MGIADFFLGQKQQNIPSLNDLRRESNRSIPERITTPGFTVRGGANDGRPFFDVIEDRPIRQARESQQGLAAALSKGLQGFGFGAPVEGINVDPERRDEVEQATFQRALNLLQPGIDRTRRQGVQGLSDRGLAAGSDARRLGLEELRDAEQFQLENLAFSAVGAGEQALTSDVNRQVASRQTELQSRQQFLNQIAQLLAPNTGQQPGIQGPTLSGGDILAPSAQSGAADAARNAQQGQLLGALLQATGQVGGAFAAGG